MLGKAYEFEGAAVSLDNGLGSKTVLNEVLGLSQQLSSEQHNRSRSITNLGVL